MPDEDGPRREIIPSLCIVDREFESGWSWSDGWNGLIPEQTKLAQIVERFGQPNAISELANGTTYDFMEGGVRATVFSEEEVISCISLYPNKLAQSGIPRVIAEAISLFGKLVATNIDPREGAVYERPGMRIYVEASTINQQIRAIEIFCPED